MSKVRADDYSYCVRPSKIGTNHRCLRFIVSLSIKMRIAIPPPFTNHQQNLPAFRPASEGDAGLFLKRFYRARPSAKQTDSDLCAKVAVAFLRRSGKIPIDCAELARWLGRINVQMSRDCLYPPVFVQQTKHYAAPTAASEG
jgi:hypothetical protein